jgi:hypothetical protein
MTGPDIAARRIGQERQPIAIIDDFHPDPAALRAHAASATFTPGLNHYPGIRAALPADYFAAVRPALAATLAGVFGHPGGIGLIDASFSIVTTPPERLETAQRLPHVDAIEPGRIALVHYLNPDEQDGTAFFRHRATGYETIDAARSPAYVERLNAELRGGGAPAGYIAGSTPLFERIAAVEARYNRAVVYRSALLHSGTIAADRVLSDDPLRGRLTVTAFLMLA